MKLDSFDRHEVYEELSTRLHKTIDDCLEDLCEEDSDFIRDRLQDEFRFWRRYGASS